MVTNRKQKKRESRERHALRRELVHAAGCHFSEWNPDATCASVVAIPEHLADADRLGVRIPRRLRGVSP